jgi:hypothetical protein
MRILDERARSGIPAPYARTLDDPFVARLEDGLQILVGDDGRRERRTPPSDRATASAHATGILSSPLSHNPYVVPMVAPYAGTDPLGTDD